MYILKLELEIYLRYEIYKTVITKNTNILEAVPCSRVETYCLPGLLDLHYDPEDGGSTFLRIVGTLPTDFTASHLEREHR
jgi:hypothetical protein